MISSTSKIIKKLGCRFNASDQKTVSCARTCDVKQVALCVVDFLQIRLVRDGFDAFLQRNNLIVARHDCHSTELQSLCDMHRAGSNFSNFCRNAFI